MLACRSNRDGGSWPGAAGRARPRRQRARTAPAARPSWGQLLSGRLNPPDAVVNVSDTGSIVSARAPSLAGVRFGPDVATPRDPRDPGTVDYRLARRSVISEFRKGRLSQADVCDAHPELVRAAQLYSRPTDERCPILADASLVLVTYVFGPTLPPHGRCVATLKELNALSKLARRHKGATFTCYVVEVCPECRWNHLSQVFPLGREARV